MSDTKGYIGIWIGTWNNKPAFVNHYYGGCNVWVYDGAWKIHINAEHPLELSELVGQGSVWDWPIDMVSEVTNEHTR